MKPVCAASGDLPGDGRERRLVADPDIPTPAWIGIGLLIAALAVRLAVLMDTIDVTGDGPVHAISAYNWSSAPYWVASGMWLPGFTYLAGAMTIVVHSPLLGPRFLNLILGSLTVPLFFALVRRVYGSPVALLSAAWLVVLPLHVGLSVSSLTETPYLFGMTAAMLCVARAAQTQGPGRIVLGCFVLFLGMAELTRYEAWAFAPLLVIYLAWKRPSVIDVLVVALALLAFPIYWSAGNYRDFGDALYGLTVAAAPLEAAQHFSAAAAGTLLRQLTEGHLGWLLPIAALGGLGVGVKRLVAKEATAEEVGLLLLTTLCWGELFSYAMAVGTAFWDRYLIFGIVLLLPFAALGYTRCLGSGRTQCAVGAIALGGVMLVGYATQGRTVFVTRTLPTDMIETASWLRNGPHHDDAVLLTKMNWQSTYLPLYFPALSRRYLIVSVWTNDDVLRAFVRDHHPSLLITQAADAQDRLRIERALGAPISTDRRIHSVHEVQVYDLSDLHEAGVSEGSDDSSAGSASVH